MNIDFNRTWYHSSNKEGLLHCIEIAKQNKDFKALKFIGKIINEDLEFQDSVIVYDLDIKDYSMMNKLDYEKLCQIILDNSENSLNL